MAVDLTLPVTDLELLAGGTSVVAFVARHAADLNDELDLVAGPPRPAGELRTGIGANRPIDLTALNALVIGVQPASSLGPGSESSFLTFVPEGDALILRVYRGNHPVLADAEFETRRAQVEAEFR